MSLTINVVGQSPTESEEYRLERQATALKQVGDWAGAIDCLKKAQAIRGPLEDDTRLAKFLQQAGLFDEAMEEIQRLIDGSLTWAEGHFGHRPRSVRRCQQASWLARIHKDAALICKREKRQEMRVQHEMESERWWAINHQLRSISEQNKESK